MKSLNPELRISNDSHIMYNKFCGVVCFASIALALMISCITIGVICIKTEKKLKCVSYPLICDAKNDTIKVCTIEACPSFFKVYNETKHEIAPTTISVYKNDVCKTECELKKMRLNFQGEGVIIVGVVIPVVWIFIMCMICFEFPTLRSSNNRIHSESTVQTDNDSTHTVVVVNEKNEESSTQDQTSSEICCICIQNLKEDIVTTSCGHSFHNNCILEWLKRKHSCPLCQATLLVEYISSTNSQNINLPLSIESTNPRAA